MRIVDQHFQPVAADRQRSLHLVRGVADELFLPLERRLGPLGIAARGIVEFPELRDGGLDGQRRIPRPHGVTVEPPQQGVERPHRAVEHDDRDQQDHQQQEEVEADHPPEDRLPEVVLLDGRSHHRQFAPLPRAVAEHLAQHAGRLLVVAFGNENLLVGIAFVMLCGGILGRHFVQEIAVVALVRRNGKLPSGQNPLDDHFGTSFERVVHLVVDLVDQREVKQHGPCRQEQRQRPRKVQQDAVNQFHGCTSL